MKFVGFAFEAKGKTFSKNKRALKRFFATSTRQWQNLKTKLRQRKYAVRGNNEKCPFFETVGHTSFTMAKNFKDKKEASLNKNTVSHGNKNRVAS